LKKVERNYKRFSLGRVEKIGLTQGRIKQGRMPTLPFWMLILLSKSFTLQQFYSTKSSDFIYKLVLHFGEYEMPLQVKFQDINLAEDIRKLLTNSRQYSNFCAASIFSNLQFQRPLTSVTECIQNYVHFRDSLSLSFEF
jgi:hypothetical protein